MDFWNYKNYWVIGILGIFYRFQLYNIGSINVDYIGI